MLTIFLGIRLFLSLRRIGVVATHKTSERFAEIRECYSGTLVPHRRITGKQNGLGYMEVDLLF